MESDTALATAMGKLSKYSTLYGQAIPLEQLIAELERQKATKKDYVLDTQSLKMRDDACIAFPDESGLDIAFEPTLWCHEQIAQKTIIPSQYYERCYTKNKPLLAANVNAWMGSKERRMVRTLDGKARAFVSDRFKAMDNVDLLYSAAVIFKELDVGIIRADLSDLHFYIKAICPNIKRELAPGDNVVSGVVLSNSEVGAGALKIEWFAYRLLTNTGVVGETMDSRTHIGGRLDTGMYTDETIASITKTTWLEVRDIISSTISQRRLDQWIEMLQVSKEIPLQATPTELAYGSWKGVDVSKDEKDKIIKHLLGDSQGSTQFGWSQAFASTAEELGSAERRIELEKQSFQYAVMTRKKFDESIEDVIALPRRRGA